MVHTSTILVKSVLSGKRLIVKAGFTLKHEAAHSRGPLASLFTYCSLRGRAIGPTASLKQRLTNYFPHAYFMENHSMFIFLGIFIPL